MSQTNVQVYNDKGCSLYGPQSIKNAPVGKPLSRAPPVLHRINHTHSPIERNTAPISRTSKINRRGLRADPYARPPMPHIELPHPPISPPLPHSVSTPMDAAIQAGFNDLSNIGVVFRRTMYQARLEFEAVERERDQLREKLRALTLGPDAPKTSPTPPPTSATTTTTATVPFELKNETAKQFSMVGPLRSSSFSGSHRHSKRRPSFRSKSAEPCLSSGCGYNDCFDVTIIGYDTTQPGWERGIMKASSDSGLIRDAINPDAPPRPAPRPAGPTELALDHIDIMYIPKNGELFCRACCVLKKSSVKTFPNNASWDDLRQHCATEHPTECRDIASLHPAELYELRRRLRATYTQSQSSSVSSPASSR